MKAQRTLKAIDSFMFGSLFFRFLITAASLVITAFVGVVASILGLDYHYLGILAFVLPVPILICICVTLQSAKCYSMAERGDAGKVNASRDSHSTFQKATKYQFAGKVETTASEPWNIMKPKELEEFFINAGIGNYHD